MQGETIYEREGFRFDYFMCLRSEYAHNDCSLCLEVCPEEAMGFERNRFRLDTQKCTGCTACMGVCPTEAFESDRFDPEAFVAEFLEEEKRLLSCGEDLPCLAALSAEHYATLLMGSAQQLGCDLSRCEGCAINRTGTVLEAINRLTEEAERFTEACGIPGRFERVSTSRPQEASGEKEEVDAGRRDLFRRLASVAREASEEAERPTVQTPLGDAPVDLLPPRRKELKALMKERADGLKAPEKESPFSFVANKRIDAMLCTNCQDCTKFCPTHALTPMQDNTGIVFQMGKCIACGICDAICQPGAITTDHRFDPVTFAFDRIDVLVKHRFEICDECKVAFPYKGGEKVCDRCRDFRSNFSDLFTLARDME